MKSISKDLVIINIWQYSRVRCLRRLRGGVHLFSGGPVEPGVVDGETSKDARISWITYWAVLGQNTDNNSGFTIRCLICLYQWRTIVQSARGRFSRSGW